MQPLNILFLNVRKTLCSWNIRLLSFLTRCSPAAALLLLLSGHTTSNWKCSWLQVLPLTSPQSLMKPISSNRGVLACIISTPFFLRLLPCYLITDRIHLWSSSFFFLVFFSSLFGNTPSWAVLQHADKHTQRGLLSKHQISQLSGGYQLCSAAGPMTDPTQTHTSGSSFVASHQSELTFKGSVHLAGFTRALLHFFPPSSSLLSLTLVLAPILVFTLIYWNVPSSLTHSSLAAGRVFTGISDTPCPWITLGSGEITAFCHLVC